jgi:hypothetical protein
LSAIMALVLLGKSICTICDEVLDAGQEIDGFAAFQVNKLDSLGRFSDAAFHHECLVHHPSYEMLQKRMVFRDSKIGPGNRKCAVCSEQMETHMDYFALGYLVEELKSPAYDLNYFQAHRSCLSNWSELETLRQRLSTLVSSDEWQGPGLEAPLAVIEEILSERTNWTLPNA